MTAYIVTTAYWNDAAVCSALDEGCGHPLDFSRLPSNYDITADKGTGKIVLTDGDEAIAGFEGLTENGDDTFTGQDQLGLSGATDAAGRQINCRDITVGDDGFGNALLCFSNGNSITLVGVCPTQVTGKDVLAAMGVPAPDEIDISFTRNPEGGTDSVCASGGDNLLVVEDDLGNDRTEGGNSDETSGDTLILTQDFVYDDITFTNTDDGAGGLSGNFTMADGTVVTFPEEENIICFTPGTMILTSHGERPIETLVVGDMVVTRDQGLRPIRWIGKRTLPGCGGFAPIRVGANALDSTRNGLLVSPNHRILFTGYRAELLFGDPEVLVPAKHLIDDKDVLRQPCEKVTYIHLMFDHHEVIYAEGIATESFHADDAGLGAIEDAAREELFALFPELRTAPGDHLETARTCLKKHEAALLVDDAKDPFL